MTLAHGVATPEDFWGAWSWEPTVLIGLVIIAAIYARGSLAIRRHRGREAAFYGGLIAIFVALVSPLHAVSEALFSAHMVQHLVLILVAAPLLVLSAPGVHLALAFPPTLRRFWHRRVRTRSVRALTSAAGNPVVVWSAHAAALWAWHLPGLYEAALRNELVHVLEHVSFLATAVLFWAVVGHRSRRRVGYGPTILFVFTTALQSGGLGALLIFADRVLYSVHISRAHDWGLTALEDQQLAGALMWIPPGFVYFIVMAALFMKWLRYMDRRTLVVEPGEL